MSDLVDEIGVGEEGRLAGGDTRDYELELEAGELVRLEVEQRGVDVAVELRDPQDNLIIRVDSPTGRRDTEKLLAVAETAGTHRLVIEGSEREAPEGLYVYRVLERRPASQEDRDRAEAERVFSEAEELRRQGKENGEALQRAVERYREALAAWQTLGDPGREGDTLLGLGRVHEALSDLETARQLMEEAVERFVQVGNPVGQGTALNFLGYLLFGLGENDEALQRYQEALEIFRAADLQDGVAGALHNLGIHYRRLGETEEALEAYSQALEVYEEIGEVDLIARTRGALAALFLQHGEVDTAEDHLQAALSVWTTLENRRQQALVLHWLGEVRKRQERFEEAVAYLSQALELHRSLQDRRREAMTLNSLGTVQLLGSAFEPARAAYEEVLALSQELEDVRGTAFAIHNLGRLHLPAPGWAGNPQSAFDYFERAAPLLEKLGDRQVTASNSYGSARALVELGRLEDACERLAASLDVVEDLRTETVSEGLRIAFFATKQHYYDLYVDVLMRLDGQQPEKGWAEQAFEISEHRRARTLLDTLGESAAEVRRGADPALLEEEAVVQEKLNVLDRQRRVLAAQAPPNREALTAIEKSLRQNREKLDDVRRRLRNTAYDRLAGAEPVGLPEIQSGLLDRRTLLLVYSLGEERSYLWAVSREAVRSHVLAQGRAEIEGGVDAARELLTSRSLDSRNARRQILARLGDQLLGPVAAELTYKRLVIVADGALLYLPFAALLEPGAEPRADGEAPYLVEHHEIVNLPSASILGGLRREFAGRLPAPKQIAVFAGPKLAPGQENGKVTVQQATVLEHPNRADLERSAQILGIERFTPLPGTLEEAQAILELAQGDKLEALGAAATKARVAGGELRDYEILHFATHGIVNREAPGLSGLVLSLYNENDLPVDGFLHLHEIYNLDLSAELVVLSACETGLGPEVRGEGLIGLTRGFMYAGVPRVLVSLWRVSDRGTAELMRRFYWSVLEVSVSPARALHVAQISMLEDAEWNHPVYWASFVLQGEWRLPGGDNEDSDIEGAFRGEGDDDGGDMDLPTPDDVCEDPAEPWMKKVCEILKRLRRATE
ncbi:MAG TPA: CHAT domain-containing tetratricopeptide repeat protein [Thermoanaerobaculia bacterium]|jgi:CHAT domain-containing protein/Tfp pilus assembly protein PilF